MTRKLTSGVEFGKKLKLQLSQATAFPSAVEEKKKRSFWHMRIVNVLFWYWGIKNVLKCTKIEWGLFFLFLFPQRQPVSGEGLPATRLKCMRYLSVPRIGPELYSHNTTLNLFREWLSRAFLILPRKLKNQKIKKGNFPKKESQWLNLNSFFFLF